MGSDVNPYEIEVANLSGPDGSWVNLPAADSPYAAVVDPELGRIALPPAAGAAPLLRFSYDYGFADDLGGGEYARGDTFLVKDPGNVLTYPDSAAVARYTTLPAALAFAVGELSQKGSVALEITTSDTLAVPSALAADLPDGTTLELRAADGTRPTLLLQGELAVTGDASSTFALNGCVLAAGAGMAPGEPDAGRARPPAGDAAGRRGERAPGGSPRPLHARARLVARSGRVAGRRRRARAGRRASRQRAHRRAVDPRRRPHIPVRDRQSDRQHRRCDRAARPWRTQRSTEPPAAGALTLQGCTVVGKVHATLLSLVSDSIFWAARRGGR